MPLVNLCHDENNFTQDAVRRVLAFMCHPHNPSARENMTRTSLLMADVLDAVHIASLKAGVAGAILMERLEAFLSEPKLPYSINRGLLPVRERLLRHIGPKYVRNNQAAGWPYEAKTRQWPISQAGMRAAYDAYLAVAPLWASALYAVEHGRGDGWPSCASELPVFLAVANAFFQAGCRMPAPEQPHPFALDPRAAVRFRIPNNLALTTEIYAATIPGRGLTLYTR